MFQRVKTIAGVDVWSCATLYNNKLTNVNYLQFVFDQGLVCVQWLCVRLCNILPCNENSQTTVSHRMLLYEIPNSRFRNFKMRCAADTPSSLSCRMTRDSRGDPLNVPIVIRLWYVVCLCNSESLPHSFLSSLCWDSESCIALQGGVLNVKLARQTVARVGCWLI